jgi:NAD(P)-dependent dehydrogenase (short-subunit alcohol dehydrogenase family)
MRRSSGSTPWLRLARIDDVRRLADQVREHGPIDPWVHNAGVWVRGSTPRTSADGHETTIAVNVLEARLLTHLLAPRAAGTVALAGLGTGGVARPQPAALGPETDPQRAYAQSKACEVALALAWNRRLPDVTSAAVDPGWVTTTLASPGAPATSARPRTPSPSAARQPTWPRRPTGRTGCRRRSPDRCGTPPSRTRSSRPAIEW